MNKLNIWSLLLLIVALTVASCSKENIDTITETEEEIIPEVTHTPNPLLSRAAQENDTANSNNSDGLNLGCVSILFPFAMVDGEGAEYPINQLEDFENLFPEDGDSSLVIDFAYPLNVSVNEEEPTVVESNEALVELFADCVPDGGWSEDLFPAYLIDQEQSCWTFVYPISLFDLDDDVSITVENEEEFVAAIAEDVLFFEFPFSLEGDSIIMEVNNVDELFNALFSCNEFVQDSTDWDWETGFEYLGCYKLVFPFTVELADGTTVEVDNHETYCDLILQGRITNYSYPLTLETEDGEPIIINSDEELQGALERCYGNVGEFDESLFLLLSGHEFEDDSINLQACYRIVFPISADYVTADSTIQTLNIDSELAIFEVLDLRPTLNFPVDVVLIADESTVTLGSIEDLLRLLEQCF
ncbi:MAG: hypothetical protein AB8G22_20935 [Saprospiraceae bacterium]